MFRKVAAILLAGLAFLLASCSTTQGPKENVSATGETVPVHVSQALAVPLALGNPSEVSPQTVQGLRVVSKVVFDIEGRPAYLANLVSREGSFERALRAAKGEEPVYLTGLLKDIAFYGDIFPAEAYRALLERCPNCSLVYDKHTLLVRTPEGKLLDFMGREVSQERAKAAKAYREAVREAHRKNGFLDELAKRWDQLIEKSPQVPSPQGLFPQSLGGEPKPLDLATEFFRGGVSPQVVGPGQCLSWFLWWCTAYQNTGYVSYITTEWYSQGQLAEDFGNIQGVAKKDRWDRWAWSPTPKQDYANPLDAPYRSDPNNTWGGWDLIGGYAWDRGENHVIGCGPVSVLRVLEVYRKRGLEGIPRDITLNLPNDNLSFSGYSVTVPGGLTTPSGLPKWAQLALWPVKLTTQNGKNIYNAWISQAMNGKETAGQGQAVLPKDYAPGANRWLADNGLRVRVTGAYLRDFDASLLLNPYIYNPAIWGPIVWLSYTQYTWTTNRLLKETIGRDDLPAVVLFEVGQVPELLAVFDALARNPYYLTPHYAPAYRYRVVEYWDWSANFATVDDSKERVIFLYPDDRRPLVPVEIYLGDYYDLSNGVWRISD
ncbi:hypothetical protein [Thermus sp.]|uniref:hypothetical protein n=1 Tax=Thermus sp. TaxID=275 RepID=UPI003D14DF72